MLCIATIAFPPSVFASDITYDWNGNSSSTYSDSANWNCTPGCASGSYPNNAAPNALVEAIINSSHNDVVDLATPAFITSLHLGGSDEHSSVLQMNSTSLTLGTATVFRDNVLSIGNGGELDVFGSHSNLTLDLTGGSGASVGAGGSLFVSTGNTVTLRDTANESTTLTNDGFIGISGALALSDGRTGSTFQFAGSGSMRVAGSIEGSDGDESLINGANHTLIASGDITLGQFTNLGVLDAHSALQSRT